MITYDERDWPASGHIREVAKVLAQDQMISEEMIRAGTASLENFSGSYPSQLLVKEIYIAMLDHL